MKQGASSKHLILILQLVLLSAATEGKKVILGEEHHMVELPCQASQKTTSFTWKYPDGTKILSKQNAFCTQGNSRLKSRVECRRNLWDQGFFHLLIKTLEMEDSGHYICEVDNKKEEVQLLVFRLTAKPGVRLLQGKSLTLTLESSRNSNPSVQWKDPRGKNKNVEKSFTVSQVGSQHSGIWKCIISQNQQTLELSINILVLGFQKNSNTVYKKEGEPVEFSFPLTFSDEELTGELNWEVEGASSRWITFSLKDKKVSKQQSSLNKLRMSETLPLSFTLPQALPQHAGCGNLTLALASGKLLQKVSLVVMRVTQHPNNLACDVLGPISPTMTLSLQLENQTAKVSTQQKQVQVLNPEEGQWLCLLSDKGKVLLESKAEVLPRVSQVPTRIAILVAAGVGSLVLLIFIGLSIFCCVKHHRIRRSQAERMSQIKRLLSEKKTCQCPHRLQKTVI